MKLLQLLISLLSHLGVAVLLCLPKSQTPPEKTLEVTPITEKQLKKRIKEAQIVSTDPKLKSKKAPDKPDYLAKQNQVAKKNQTVKKSGDFIQGQGEFGSAPKSISQKGKFKPEKKGKGVSTTDDFILGAEIGPMTILNSQEFKYFSYYDRIKEQITINWRPLVRLAIKLVKSNPKKYGQLEVKYYTTKLEIKLNPKGEILEIKVVQDSGQKKFDDAASDAFRKSVVFASPPKEIIKNGSFVLRFDFTVNVEQESIIGAGKGQI